MKKWTKNEKNDNKKQKKDKQTGEKKSGKKRKRGPKGVFTTPRLKIFNIRTVKRNRNEIEAPKKSDFEHPVKKNRVKNRVKENERKWNKMKENDRKWKKEEKDKEKM